MSYCVLPVYFRPGSVCINTQVKQEEAGERRGEVAGAMGREQKRQNLQGHLSKIENVNNGTRGGGVGVGVGVGVGGKTVLDREVYM